MMKSTISLFSKGNLHENCPRVISLKKFMIMEIKKGQIKFCSPTAIPANISLSLKIAQ